MRVATLLLLLWAVAVSAASAVDLCSQSFCACPDAGKRVVCKCDGVKVSSSTINVQMDTSGGSREKKRF